MSIYSVADEALETVLKQHFDLIASLERAVLTKASLATVVLDILEDVKGYVGSEAAKAETEPYLKELAFDAAEDWAASELHPSLRRTLAAGIWLYGEGPAKAKFRLAT